MSKPSGSLYDILGVSKADSCTVIKKAYLKLARTHHPDKGGDPEKFKEILRASEVLTDEKRRRLYDETGLTDEQQMHQGGFPPGGFPFPFGQGGPPGGFPFEVNLNDLFGGMFGNPPVGPQRGPIRKGKKSAPATQSIHLTLEQFYLGHSFEITINRQSFCDDCEHTGAKTREMCRKCNGQGAITQVVHVGPMAMHTTGPCLDCQGKGERVLEVCKKCSGQGFLAEKRVLSVRVIPGTKPHETFIFPEVCSDHPAFERPGDAHIMVEEDSNDPAFKCFLRKGDNLQHLETKVTLSLAESLLGCVVQLDSHPGYDEGLFVRIPAGSFQGDTYCLSGFGMPIPGNIGKYGDLYIVVEVSVKPSDRKLLSTKGRDLLLPLFKDNVRAHSCVEEAIQEDVYICSSTF
jgi:DnaJ-class molecular chaperone